MVRVRCRFRLWMTTFVILWAAPLALLADTHYVNVSNAVPRSPYTNWTDAATNIQAAIDAAVDTDTVLVTNGTYVLGATITVTNGVTVQSVNGYWTCVIDGGNRVRCVSLDHPDALVGGFTITRGKAGIESGGGAAVMRGRLRNCAVVGNSARLGAGVLCSGGGIVRNCLITKNQSVDYVESSWGGGIYCNGFVENCTIVSNAAQQGGGVIAESGCQIQNSIVVGNEGWDNSPQWKLYSGGGSIEYCCTTPLPPGQGNTTSDPMFVNSGLGDFRLLAESLCIDSGTDLELLLDERVARSALPVLHEFRREERRAVLSGQGRAPVGMRRASTPQSSLP